VCAQKEELDEVPKEGRIIHRREETSGKISKDPGVRTLGGFPRENKNLRKVAKSGLNPDCWIWKGCVEVICTLQRSITLGDI
jgi:hypothetical protein